jgi:hypothetical protein
MLQKCNGTKLCRGYGNAFGQALLTDNFARRQFRRSGTWHADAHHIGMGICTLVLDPVITVVDCTNALLPLSPVSLNEAPSL